jgi:hypothetical protein
MILVSIPFPKPFPKKGARFHFTPLYTGNWKRGGFFFNKVFKIKEVGGNGKPLFWALSRFHFSNSRFQPFPKPFPTFNDPRGSRRTFNKPATIDS